MTIYESIIISSMLFAVYFLGFNTGKDAGSSETSSKCQQCIDEKCYLDRG